MSAGWRHLWLCAQHELVLAVRSRWLQTFAVVFAALVVLVAASGYLLSGGRGVQEFSRTAMSLIEIVLLIVPLTTITFGIMQLTPERGAAELIFAQPVPRHVILLGRLLGLFLALVAAQAIGFGTAGLLIFWSSGSVGLAGFLGVMLSAVALTSVFLALGALVSAGHTSQRRARALAVGLVIWFVSVLLFDVAALAAATMFRSGTASRMLIVSVFLNPVDAVRTGALLAVNGTAAFGAASLAFLRFTRGAAGAALAISGSVVFWLVVPVWFAAWRLERTDI